jgi:TfoX/Sxy family transcriptional regulator of competence genes
MAYDEGLAERIRGVLQDRQDVTEKKMFGGVAFLLQGKMFVGIVKDDLMVRVGPARHEESLAKAHVRPMDFAGRPMAGYVYVAPEGTAEDRDLEFWVGMAAAFVSALPPKKEKKASPRRKKPRTRT